ncbi:MAG TPA: UDP-2,3-diacylglucosamine diphosphatase LpxI [Terriglobia bacterium]|nr:UDP-2,3-diacylglucosamine diphosphatase LpxI [Terriglobia bacterium]
MAQSLNHSIAQSPNRLAVIAGNGHFPFLVLDAARDQGIDPLVVAVKEECSPQLAEKTSEIHWLGLGEITRLLELLAAQGIRQVVLAGQVRHVQMFKPQAADSLARDAFDGLERRNTDALIGAFVRMLEERGIEVVDSTLFLKPLVPQAGTLTRRAPDAAEQADIAYGREIAREMARLDIGQTVVVADRACLAVEAMEGTDSTIARAATLGNGRRLVVVKVSKPDQDMRFDVPVVGPKTIEVMTDANARALALDAGKTLLFERERMIRQADEAGIAIVACD